MARPKQPEPWTQIPLRLTPSQRAKVTAYQAAHGLPNLATALRYMIEVNA